MRYAWLPGMAFALVAAARDEERRRQAMLFFGVGVVALVSWAVVGVLEKLFGTMFT